MEIARFFTIGPYCSQVPTCLHFLACNCKYLPFVDGWHLLFSHAFVVRVFTIYFKATTSETSEVTPMFVFQPVDVLISIRYGSFTTVLSCYESFFLRMVSDVICVCAFTSLGRASCIL